MCTHLSIFISGKLWAYFNHFWSCSLTQFLSINHYFWDISFDSPDWSNSLIQLTTNNLNCHPHMLFIIINWQLHTLIFFHNCQLHMLIINLTCQYFKLSTVNKIIMNSLFNENITSLTPFLSSFDISESRKSVWLLTCHLTCMLCMKISTKILHENSADFANTIFTIPSFVYSFDILEPDVYMLWWL